MKALPQRKAGYMRTWRHIIGVGLTWGCGGVEDMTRSKHIIIYTTISNTSLIMFQFQRASAWRGSRSGSTKQKHGAKERKLTIMLVTLCLIFIFCTIPGLIFQVSLVFKAIHLNVSVKILPYRFPTRDTAMQYIYLF